MKKKIIATLVVICNVLICCAADPGGTPGFVKAIFTGSSFNQTGDINSNAIGYTMMPDEMYATSLQAETTIGWIGYMKMEGGVTYNFKGRYDDYLTVKIGGELILTNNGSYTRECSSSYSPPTSDWYLVELRVANTHGQGGCWDSMYYGILWKKSSDLNWSKFSVYDTNGEILFKTGRSDLERIFSESVQIISSKIRENDPTIMDVTYIVHSSLPTVNVRALAFEDGERRFSKILRPESFVDGTAVNIGDNIPANVEHKLSWKVSADWAARLAKVKFEVIVKSGSMIPFRTMIIPASEKYGKVEVAYCEASKDQLLNALYWLYADNAADFKLNGSSVSCDGFGEVARLGPDANPWVRISAGGVRYVYSKLGFSVAVVASGEINSTGATMINSEMAEYTEEETRLGLLNEGSDEYFRRKINNDREMYFLYAYKLLDD